MDAYYNRYQQFSINGEQTVVPFIPLQSKSSDQSSCRVNRWVDQKN